MLLCRRTECGEETGEQSVAVWSSSCCLPDQRGNKRGLPGPALLWRCLTDSQQLGPHSPPCMGHAAGLQGPSSDMPSLDRGKRQKGLDGVNRRRDVCVCFVVVLYRATSEVGAAYCIFSHLFIIMQGRHMNPGFKKIPLHSTLQSSTSLVLTENQMEERERDRERACRSAIDLF